MKPSRPKRRRLISSYVSPQRPDLPARFESLNHDTLTTTLEFVGNRSYAIYAGINKQCKEIYLATPRMTKETFLYGYAPLSVIKDKIERAILDNDWEVFERVGKGGVLYNRRDVMEWALEARKDIVLKGICNVAGREGRINLLDEVWNNVNDMDVRRSIFREVDVYAARGGKLNVLKLFEIKELSINKTWCADEAAYHGQLYILKWLKEERGLELDGGLYYSSIFGGQLHVMKWLREQEVDWDESPFANAARKGNLDILQWLHDEGCPWPEDDDLRVHEDEIEPEVLEWLRTNGYGNMIDYR